MERELTSAIHPIMMDRDTTLMDKEEKVINTTSALSLEFVAEAILQLGFTPQSIKNNMGIKTFLRVHNIHPNQFNQALTNAQVNINKLKTQAY